MTSKRLQLHNQTIFDRSHMTGFVYILSRYLASLYMQWLGKSCMDCAPRSDFLFPCVVTGAYTSDTHTCMHVPIHTQLQSTSIHLAIPTNYAQEYMVQHAPCTPITLMCTITSGLNTPTMHIAN